MCLQEDIGGSFCAVQNQHGQFYISPFPMKGICLREGIRRDDSADLGSLQFCQVKRWQAAPFCSAAVHSTEKYKFHVFFTCHTIASKCCSYSNLQ